MNTQSSTEIIYKDIKILENSKISNGFPVMLVQNSLGEQEELLLHCFQKDAKPDYLIIGKFAQNRRPNLKSVQDIEWFRLIKALIQNKSLQTNYDSYLKAISALTTYSMTNSILFTQEGYDLLTGKFLFTKDGKIQRTVQLDCITQGESLLFGNKYYSVNHDNKVKTANLFDSFQKYQDEYFMNNSDLENMNAETAQAYAIMNNRRMLKYMQKIQPNWQDGHYDKTLERNPTKIGDYSLQLLDVVTSFQATEHNAKRR